jgi:hypothetical protein
MAKPRPEKNEPPTTRVLGWNFGLVTGLTDHRDSELGAHDLSPCYRDGRAPAPVLGRGDADVASPALTHYGPPGNLGGPLFCYPGLPLPPGYDALERRLEVGGAGLSGPLGAPHVH